jgi:GNAT superfamily N-acetyltransferase
LHALCTDELPAGWEETVSAHSMAAIMNLTGMAADQFLEPIRPLPTLDWRSVTDIKTATDLAHLNAHAYGMPAELFDAVCNMHIWQDDCVAMVGYLDNQPVTSAAALPVAGTIYIALVASHADHRGKGYAEACIREVVEEAKPIMSSEKITLHASDAGKPLYAQMGFEASTNFALLTLVNPEAEAH